MLLLHALTLLTSHSLLATSTLHFQIFQTAFYFIPFLLVAELLFKFLCLPNSLIGFKGTK